jgi:hypothetical protein
MLFLAQIQHYPIVTQVNVLVGEEKRRKFDWSVSLLIQTLSLR